MADEDDEGFGDFHFVSPLSITNTHHINPLPPQKDLHSGRFTSSQSNLSNGSIAFEKPKGALPLSLFGELEEPESGDNGSVPDNSSNLFDNGNIAGNLNSGVGFPDVLAKLYNQNQEIKSGDGSGVNSNGLVSNSRMEPDLGEGNDEGVDDDEDDWEFMCASLENGGKWDSKERGALVMEGLKLEPMAITGDREQAGQSASLQIESKPQPSSMFADFSDPFVAYNEVSYRSSEVDAGINSNLDVDVPNGFALDPFPKVEEMQNRNGTNASSMSENEDFDEFGDFVDASFGVGSMQQRAEMVAQSDSTRAHLPNGKVQSASLQIESKPQSSSMFGDFSDSFVTSNGVSYKSSEVDAEIGSKSAIPVPNGFASDSFPKVEEIQNRNGTNTSSASEDEDFDEFGDFVDASPRVGSMQQRKEVVVQSDPTEAQLPTGKIQDATTQPVKDRGALPLFFFGDAVEEAADSLDHQDDFTHKPTSSYRTGITSQTSGISIHDLISNLYSQAQDSSSFEDNQKPSENGFHSSHKISNPTLVHGNDNFVGSSWEFRDAFSKSGVKEQSFYPIPVDADLTLSDRSSDVQFYVDFYTKLRDELCGVVSCHLDDIKKAQGSDSLACEDAEGVALDNGIEEASKLLQECTFSGKIYVEQHMRRDKYFDEVLELLQGPKFQVVELEYHLSRRLKLAKKDPKISIGLLRHSRSTLRILALGSLKEQSIYVSAWSKIIDVCALELRHGALIWEKALEKNVRGQILSDKRGQSYILALGEIYRVAELLRVSARIYKPWILLSAAELVNIYPLLDDCIALWSSSGLKEAVENVSNDVSFHCHETAKALVDSIKHVHENDDALYDAILVQRRSVCQLSLLPLETLPEMKMVMWNEKPYFLSLANLWANLISSDPPESPHLHVV